MLGPQPDGEVQSFYTGEHGYQGYQGHQVLPTQSQREPPTAPADSREYRGHRRVVEPVNDETNDTFAAFVSHNATMDETVSTDQEEASSRVLEVLLVEDMQVYETEPQKRHKESVLAKLNEILDQWMRRVRRKHGLPPDSSIANVKLLCYGSYLLGVSSPTGDIDAMILTHYFVDRNEDFFGVLYPLLVELQSQNKELQDVTMVNQENTVMPLIKMTFYGVPIDMVFSRVQYSDDLDEFVKTKIDNEEYMQAMDEKMKRSFNGYRNNAQTLKSIRKSGESYMNTKREEIFRTTLKCIKLWAKRNGLDSNKMGYLGGIAWAILTAKICKLYPYKSPSRLLERFFWLYGTEWQWDSWFVCIEKLEDMPNQKVKRSMYIMTPCRPQQNSTFNATTSTREIMVTRMREAHSLVARLLDRQQHAHDMKPDDAQAKSEWMVLFNKYNFFESYEHFIEINILCSKDSDHLRWVGFVEAKIRILCERFEDLLKFYSLKIHPWPTVYSRDKHIFPGYPIATTVYIGMRLEQDVEDGVDLNIPVIRFVEYLDLEWLKDNPPRDKQSYNLSVHYKTREELPKDVLNADVEVSDSEDLKSVEKLPEDVKSRKDEQKDLVLSAHKSTLKDDLNQDADPEEEIELVPKLSVQSGLAANHEPSSPAFKVRHIEQVDPEGPEDLFAAFDRDFEAIGTSHDVLQKRAQASFLAGRLPVESQPKKTLKVEAPSSINLQGTKLIPQPLPPAGAKPPDGWDTGRSSGETASSNVLDDLLE